MLSEKTCPDLIGKSRFAGKNLCMLFIAILLLQITTLAQEGWFEQTSETAFGLRSVYFTNDNSGWAVGSGGTILKTTDGGTNWIPQTSDTTEWLNSVHFTNDTTGWAVGGNGFEGIILNTTDGGTNWNSQTGGTMLPLSSVYFTDDTGWAVGVGGTILNTTDEGTNWNFQTSGTTEDLYSVQFIDNNTGWAVGTNGAILYTTNGGTNWNSQIGGTKEGLFSVHFNDNNTGWTVGDSGTILKTTNGGVSFVEEQEIDEIATNYSLTNNYPNPFNPSTKIKYSVPKSSNVVIKVFDILGKEIETLVNEEKQTGTYEITWCAENLPSGIYFYRIQAGDFVETKKMILLK